MGIVVKLISYTLVVLFLVLLIAGRPQEGKELAQDKPATHEVALAEVGNGLASLFDAAKPSSQSDPVVIPAAGTVDAQSAPVITPLRLAPMPGPALRPSPEYRTRETPAATTGGTLFTVATDRLNVRSGPSTSNAVIESLTRGEDVLVISDTSAKWVQIRIEGDGVEGWVARSLLRPAH